MPSLWRVHDPAGSATLSVYATLPRTPNGTVAFAPDGTIYVQTGYNDPTPQVVTVSGTNVPSPPTITPVPDLTSFLWVRVATAQPDGAAKSLIILDSTGLELVDITTTPYTKTLLIAGESVGSGSTGPDGCLYTALGDTVFKLTAADGTCGFVPTNPAPALSLTPATVTPDPALGSTQTFSATFTNVSVPTGTPVTFSIAGANSQVKLATTNAAGSATISYPGAIAGRDTVTAMAVVGATPFTSNASTLNWGACMHVAFLDLGLAPSSAPVGSTANLVAALSDVSVTPAVPIVGVPLQFTLGGQSCNATTNGSGVASCSVTPPAGELTLMATFAGNAQFTAVTASQRFSVFSAEGPTVPGVPTDVGASAGDAFLTVTFTAPASDGGSPVTSYTVTCTPTTTGDVLSAIGGASPIHVFGAMDGVTYTCMISAANIAGSGAPSAASNPVTFAAAQAPVAEVPTLDRSHELVLAALMVLLAFGALRTRRRVR